MKVTRGRTFQNDVGVWEKLEVELTTEDLLEEERAVESHLQPLLLEIRAESQLISFAGRLGNLDAETVRSENSALKLARRRVLSGSKATLPERLSR